MTHYDVALTLRTSTRRVERWCKFRALRVRFGRIDDKLVARMRYNRRKAR